jgi:hypothetical protein
MRAPRFLRGEVRLNLQGSSDRQSAVGASSLYIGSREISHEDRQTTGQGRLDCGLRRMAFVVASIYAVAVLFCVGITAWIVRAWTRRRYWHKTPSDLHYIAVGAALLVGAGIGILIASQIVVVLGYAG